MITSSSRNDHLNLFEIEPGNPVHPFARRVFDRFRQMGLALDRPIDPTVHHHMHQRIREADPEAARALGMMSPVTQVTTFPEGQPCAHDLWPRLFLGRALDSADDGTFFLLSPIGYRGHSFFPRGNHPVSPDKVNEKAKLFAHGHRTVSARIPEGVPMPRFDSRIHRSILEETPAFSGAAFLPAGRTLAMLQAFQQRKAEQARAETAIAADITRRLQDVVRAALGPSTPNVRLSGRLVSPDDAPQRQMEISAFSDDEPVIIPRNDWFHAPDTTNPFVVHPRLETPEGRRLEKLLATLPPPPLLTDYPGLCAKEGALQSRFGLIPPPNALVPVIKRVEGVDFLVYPREPAGFKPPDAVPVSRDAVLWLLRREKEPHVTAPPLPPSALAKELAQLAATLPSSRPGPRLAP